MPIARTFLDWSQPALPQAAEFLIEKFSQGDVSDMENVVVVLPGGRAGRRLLEILVERCEQASQRLTPPHITTMGRLPELLYESKKPFADEFVQSLAWAQALHRVDRDRVRQVIPNLPSHADGSRGQAFGELLLTLHHELAGDGLHFGDVAEQGPRVAGFDESRRWQILREIQEAYLQTLDDLDLWDQQTARLFAIDHNECRTDRQVVLVGTADMNRTMRQMLDQVADRVTALVHAPSEIADRFDAHGCVIPETWQDVVIDLDKRQVQVVDGPAEQADEVARSIAEYDGRYRADEITIGMADAQLVPQIRRQLSQLDIGTRWVVGRTLPETAPYRFLECVADFLENPGYRELAALVRHPDVFAWIAEQKFAPANESNFEGDNSGVGIWLTQLDDYFNQHLQHQLGEWLGPPESYARIKPIVDGIQDLMAPLTGPPDRLGNWANLTVELIARLYDHIAFDVEQIADAQVVRVCELIGKVVGAHTSLPQSLVPTVPACEAIRLALGQLAAETIPPPADADAIELLGWLELPLDDAPALIVSTFNEGHVPKSVNADLFLPDRLRRELGMDENKRRYARDAYALSVLLASRTELQLIVARRDTNGDPLRPSRLLFATGRAEIAERVLAFFDAAEQPRRPRLAGMLTATRDDTDFVIPRPKRSSRPIRRIGVTAFRDYLACPYRYYLKHVLKLEAHDDDAVEMDGRFFGTLMHIVLNQFGMSAVRDSTDVGEIGEFLEQEVDRQIVVLFGPARVAALDVQIQQMRFRLNAFAAWQAKWAACGWRIRHSEVPLSGTGARLKIDEKRSIELRGRIDRIDHHPAEKRWIIADYKTGGTAQNPDNTRRKNGEWIDLQLPLYRRITSTLKMPGKIELGYIVIPKDVKEIDFLAAKWSDDEQAAVAAEAVAVDVARKILDEEFWPPQRLANDYTDDYAAICQVGIFDREVTA